MADLTPTHGVVIHSRADWPCRVCRPELAGADDAILLCVSCAEEIAADVVAAEGRTPMPSDFAESSSALRQRAEGWSAARSWNFHPRG